MGTVYCEFGFEIPVSCEECQKLYGPCTANI